MTSTKGDCFVEYAFVHVKFINTMYINERSVWCSLRQGKRDCILQSILPVGLRPFFPAFSSELAASTACFYVQIHTVNLSAFEIWYVYCANPFLVTTCSLRSLFPFHVVNDNSLFVCKLRYDIERCIINFPVSGTYLSFSPLTERTHCTIGSCEVRRYLPCRGLLRSFFIR